MLHFPLKPQDAFTFASYFLFKFEQQLCNTNVQFVLLGCFVQSFIRALALVSITTFVSSVINFICSVTELT